MDTSQHSKPATPLWESKICASCTLWSIQSQSNHLLQQPSGKPNGAFKAKATTSCSTHLGEQNVKQVHTFGRLNPDRPPATTPLWARMFLTSAHFGALKARSTTSYNTPLGKQQARQLHTLKHSKPKRPPPATPLWESEMYDSCTLWGIQGQIDQLQQHPSGRTKCATVAHFGTLKARSTTSNNTPLPQQNL